MKNSSLGHYLRLAQGLTASFVKTPRVAATHLKNIPLRLGALDYARGTDFSPPIQPTPSNSVSSSPNPLRTYFDANTEGPGIWKWEHYFEIYHRHLAKFVGRPGHLVEIGVYSGGSLPMWRSYFGPSMQIHGIDIEPACESYQDEGIDISIGDQSDRGFWLDFRRRHPQIDVLIDDGGHLPEQQKVTLEEMLPHLAPGGVYICEDIHQVHHQFADYVSGLCNAINEGHEDNRPGLGLRGLSRWCHSIHVYPLAVVIEKHTDEQDRLHDRRRGTEWQPFFDKARS